jgi:hypothetical protein
LRRAQTVPAVVAVPAHVGVYLARRRARHLRAARSRARVVPQIARPRRRARRRREPHRRRARRRRRASRAVIRTSAVRPGRSSRRAVPPGLRPEARGRARRRRRRRAELGRGRQTFLFRQTVLSPRRRARALCRGDSLGPTPPEAHQRHHRAEARALLRAFGNAGSRAPGTPRAAVVVARRRTARRRRGGAFAAAAARGAPAVGVHLAPSALRAERPPGLVHRPPEGEHAPSPCVSGDAHTACFPRSPPRRPRRCRCWRRASSRRNRDRAGAFRCAPSRCHRRCSRARIARIPAWPNDGVGSACGDAPRGVAALAVAQFRLLPR